MNSMKKFILQAYSIHADGNCMEIKDDQQLSKRLKAKDLAWAHLDATHEGTAEWLQANIDYLDPVIIDALLAENTRPRMEEFENGVMVILRGINMNANQDPEDMVSLRMWVDESRIISLQRRNLKTIEDIAKRMEKPGFVTNAGEFLAQLSLRLLQNMEPFVSNLNESLDDIEEELAEKPNAMRRREITEIRKEAIMYRRYFAPQKDVMVQLKATDFEWFGQKSRRQIQENQDRLTRYIEDMDSIRERAQIIKDELANILSERLNKNLYTLSIISAIFLPLSFLTGLLGINVGGMPGANNDVAFWVVVGICVILCFFQMLIFRLFRWL